MWNPKLTILLMQVQSDSESDFKLVRGKKRALSCLAPDEIERRESQIFQEHWKWDNGVVSATQLPILVQRYDASFASAEQKKHARVEDKSQASTRPAQTLEKRNDRPSRPACNIDSPARN
jgi:hypothetical protein